MLYHQKTHNKRRARTSLMAGVVLIATILMAACSSSAPAATPTGVATLPVATAPAATVAPTVAPTAAPTEAASEATPLPTEEAVMEAFNEVGMAAFVRAGILYLQTGATEADLLPLEDCSAGNCFVYHLAWSPTGDHLIYYLGSYDGVVPHQIRLADRTGATQTLTEQAAYVQPAGWSWDGTAVAYRTDTDRYAEVTDGPAMRVQELWSVTVAQDGTLGTPTLHGEVTFGEGCGGGGRSESANVYEREGGFAYGYLSGIMRWTPGDILLYSDNCTNQGVSRFDLANNVALEPLPGNLRSLALNGTGDAWVAINGDNQLVTGTPDTLDIEVIETATAPELVTVGKVTGTIYYTTLKVTDSVDLIEQASATLDQSILIFPYFDTTEATLVMLDPTTGAQSQLAERDAYAFARIRENADGSVLYSAVESNAELQAAVENNALTAENWRDYLPMVDVYAVTPGSPAILMIANAEQYTPVP